MKIRTSADPKFYFEAAIFSAFKVQQQTAIQPITNTTTPIIDSSVSLKEDTKIKLAPIDSVFSYHEHPVETKTNHLQTKTENKIPLTIEDIFIGIAANNNAESKQKAQEFLASVKTELHPGVLSFLIPAAKIIVASKHGFVLVYDDELDAQFLNDKYNNFDFLNKVRKYFGKPMYIIGVSRHQLLSLADKFKNLRNQGRSFLEPPIDDLEEILKRNSSITQTAYEIYNN
jgi:hypothetical protein